MDKEPIIIQFTNSSLEQKTAVWDRESFPLKANYNNPDCIDISVHYKDFTFAEILFRLGSPKGAFRNIIFEMQSSTAKQLDNALTDNKGDIHVGEHYNIHKVRFRKINTIDDKFGFTFPIEPSCSVRFLIHQN